MEEDGRRWKKVEEERQRKLERMSKWRRNGKKKDEKGDKIDKTQIYEYHMLGMCWE